ncbi:hypothetical protein HCN44_008291 [Aphidius gifuensis]|uniref:Uncharacterized protein n=1 Tax=Aphidius gifuensis TaxID=684658 RepID=A0A834XQ61_APHGI|nr:armadillo repeat-containing protein 6 homolog [Aphidius gifuensis]KAF7989617.1 hypothetical protein HCN44_008291 [Aphidius gifuensis]
MVRVIKQETYDEVVKENIEEFDMSPQEAVDDAIKQFEAQGIDLSNIIKDLALDNNENTIKICLDNLKCLLENKNFDDVESIFNKLKIELNKDIARRVYAGKENAYNIIIDILKLTKDNLNIFKAGLSTLISLMNGHPDLLDDNGIEFQINCLDEIEDISTVQLVLKWIKECCIKHEKNRQNIFTAKILDRLMKIVKKNDVNGDELRAACGVMRALVLDDDLRHEYGKAHEHAAQIARSSLEILTLLLSKFKDNEKVVGDLMLTLATLIVRNEFCQEVEDAGGLTFILDVIINHPDTERLNWQALKLLKALAGNDNVKAHIITSGSAPLIISTLSRFKTSENVVAAGLACISALTLRSSSNSGVFYDCGAPGIIVDALKHYPKSQNVIKQGSWAIRNMTVRNKTESLEFITHGIESIFQDAIANHGSALEQDVKAAMRDLGLKVNLKEQWTGKGVAMTNDRV